MDFTRELSLSNLALVGGRAHYDTVVGAVRSAKRSIWIATANLKELMVDGGRPARGRVKYRSILQEFEELAEKRVEIRILHASLPSRPFRERFDTLPGLVDGGIDLRMCPRLHFKTVIVDAEFAYIGSANWTGAGLGAKGSGRRNFELGFTSSDDSLIDELQELFHSVWTGEQCRGCKMRDRCEAPIDEL